jgi:hypothetical protein
MNYSDSESWFKHVQASPTTLDLLLVVLKRLQKNTYLLVNCHELPRCSNKMTSTPSLSPVGIQQSGPKSPWDLRQFVGASTSLIK